MSINHKITCLVDGSRGIFAWQQFIQNEDATKWGVEPEDVVTLTNGPDDPNYWEAAANVEMGAEYLDSLGYKWHLYQDGDIFALRDDLSQVEFEEAFA